MTVQFFWILYVDYIEFLVTDALGILFCFDECYKMVCIELSFSIIILGGLLCVFMETNLNLKGTGC